MPDEERFVEALRGRVKLARETRTRHSQNEMAKALGVTKERYQKWENRSAMPLYYLERFILITQCDPLWLLFGESRRKLEHWANPVGRRNNTARL